MEELLLRLESVASERDSLRRGGVAPVLPLEKDGYGMEVNAPPAESHAAWVRR
jgi:hypothetical protein